MNKQQIIVEVEKLIEQRKKLLDKITEFKQIYLERFAPVKIGDSVHGTTMYRFDSTVTLVYIDNNLQEHSLRIRFRRIKKDGTLGQEHLATPFSWFTRIKRNAGNGKRR